MGGALLQKERRRRARIISAITAEIALACGGETKDKGAGSASSSAGGVGGAESGMEGAGSTEGAQAGRGGTPSDAVTTDASLPAGSSSCPHAYGSRFCGRPYGVVPIIVDGSFSCSLEMPTDSEDPIDLSALGVFETDNGVRQQIPDLGSRAECSLNYDMGWYYDNREAPERIQLCPATCESFVLENFDIEEMCHPEFCLGGRSELP